MVFVCVPIGWPAGGSICFGCMYYDRLSFYMIAVDFSRMQNYSIDACIVSSSFKSQLSKQSSLTLLALYFKPKLRDRAICNSSQAKRPIIISATFLLLQAVYPSLARFQRLVIEPRLILVSNKCKQEPWLLM